MSNKLKRFEALHLDLIILQKELEKQTLPAKSDERLMTAEVSAINTILYLLDECITNSREELKRRKK